jgi:hypothetical protein
MDFRVLTVLTFAADLYIEHILIFWAAELMFKTWLEQD